MTNLVMVVIIKIMNKKYLYTFCIAIISFASFYLLVIQKNLETFEWWELAIYLIIMLILIFFLIRKRNEK